MKKLFKSRLFFFVLGVLITVCISTVFAYSYVASEVGFTPQDTNWNVDNVDTALNRLRANGNVWEIAFLVRINGSAFSYLYKTENNTAIRSDSITGSHLSLSWNDSCACYLVYAVTSGWVYVNNVDKTVTAGVRYYSAGDLILSAKMFENSSTTNSYIVAYLK